MEKSVAKCDFCNKEFNKAAYRNRHVKRVHLKNSTNDKPQVIYTCALCDKQYTRKLSLQSHITAVHLPECNKYLNCKKCGFKTIHKFNLKRHSLKVHQKGKDEVTKLVKLYKRTLCNSQYTNLRRLRYHERKNHEIGGPPKVIIKRKCPICNFITTGPNAEPVIHEHFEVIHDIKLQIQQQNFSSIDSFFEWKKETEKKTVSVFIKRISSSKVMIFRCHRGGIYKKRGSNKRYLKIMGSCKIGGFCPAMMKVKIMTDQSVKVHYISKHVGHKMELKHIHLSKTERDQIATQLASKIPHGEIMKGVRGTLSTNSLNRIHLINKKDLINIEKCFNINSESMKHPFDPVSIEAWVQDLKTSEDIALLAYKPQGLISNEFPQLEENDFFLLFMTRSQMEILKKYGKGIICIDGTHVLNNYNFQLYTILTLDDCREGFPCSFLFTNRGDEMVLTKFIEMIKQNTGVIKPNVFMSDMEEGFYSAWEANMGPPKVRLFCTWHVLKAWRKNINSKIKNKEKREMVYKMLQTLLYELDEETFYRLLPQALNRLSLDPETQTFQEYFKTYYVDKGQFRCWAYCHRINAGINTNMSLENFNRVLKYCYLRGEKVKRLDKTLCAILHIIRDKLFDIIIKLEKGKLVRKLQNLRSRHKSSLSLDTEIITRLSDDSWQVLSSTQSEFYTIKRIQHCTECQLVCTHCKSCFHQFVCSCLDNSIRNNMCKHIHLVCRSMCNDGLQSEDSVNLDNDSLLIDTLEEEKNKIEYIILDELSYKKEKVLSLDDRKNNLIEEFKAIIKNSVETEEQLTSAEKLVKQLIPTIKATKLVSGRPLQIKSDIPSFPENSNVEKQRRFLSTRKRREHTGINQITKNERQNIALDLLQEH